MLSMLTLLMMSIVFCSFHLTFIVLFSIHGMGVLLVDKCCWEMHVEGMTFADGRVGRERHAILPLSVGFSYCLEIQCLLISGER